MKIDRMKLLNAMKRAGIDAGGLEDRGIMSRNALHRALTREPSQKTVNKLASALGVDASDILEGEEQNG